MSKPINPKPCPFCGSKRIDITNRMTESPFLFFKCRNCGAVVSFDNELTKHSPRLAVANWNKRTNPKILMDITYRKPKEPDTKHIGMGIVASVCPTCNEVITDEDYCPKCGQAIKWGNCHDRW